MKIFWLIRIDSFRITRFEDRQFQIFLDIYSPPGMGGRPGTGWRWQRSGEARLSSLLLSLLSLFLFSLSLLSLSSLLLLLSSMLLSLFAIVLLVGMGGCPGTGWR